METTTEARVLIRREVVRDGSYRWVAQVLEHDLAAQASSIDEILYEVRRMIVGHILSCEEQGLDPYAVPPAPKEYEDEYNASESTLSLVITRGKPDEAMMHEVPHISARFARGV
ncbi:MAG: hypothetical protein H0X39_00800 [Actinobacteria bacterium]|nr:hypothetical protein [Actinomycetota bacterium]